MLVPDLYYRQGRIRTDYRDEHGRAISLKNLTAEQQEAVLAPQKKLSDAMTVEDTGAILKFLDRQADAKPGPIGGFVKIAGENGIEATAPIEKQFESKPWYLKSAVLVAGVTCNILLAIVLFTAAYAIGMPVASDHGTPTVTSIVAGSPSAKRNRAAHESFAATPALVMPLLN